MIIGIATVDKDVTRVQQRQQAGQHVIHCCRRQHQPDGTRHSERGDQFVQRRRAGSPQFSKACDSVCIPVVHNAGMPA